MTLDLTALNNATVAYYPFDEGTGTTAGDSTPNNNDGTIDGASWTTDSKIGSHALSYDGSNDKVDLPSGTSSSNPFISGRSGTLNAWINPSSITGSHTIFDLQAGASSIASLNTGVLFRVISDGSLQASAGKHTVGNSITSSSGVVSTGAYQMVTFVFTDTTFELYYNGNSIATGSSDSGDIEWDRFNGNYLGYREQVNGHWFNGVIDEAAIFDEALTTDEIEFLYASGSPTSDQQYKFSDESLVIKGTVTLEGSPVEGATVRVFNQTTETYIDDTLTDASGEYSFDLSTEDDYHLFVEYEQGGTLYNAESLHSIEPEDENV